MVRREETRKLADQMQNRPRPAVRPASPPSKVMPQVQAPSVVRAQARVGAPPRPQANLPKAAAGAAVAGAAVMGAVGLARLQSSNNPDLSPLVTTLQNDLASTESNCSLSEVHSDMANLDAAYHNAAALLEGAREKGYRFQGDLEDLVFRGVSEWQSQRSQVEQSVFHQANLLQRRLMMLNPMIQQANSALVNPVAAGPVLRSAQNSVNQLQRDATQARYDLEKRYEHLETQAQQANSRLTQIHWALEQAAGAKFALESGEDLVMAVKARWDKEGKEDPEGILYLTNKRLLFERKEKVATKKVLFITTASELVQEVVIDQALANVVSVEADHKGLFGHQDYLVANFADKQLGKVALHIDGQESKVWAELVGKVKSGQIEAERTGQGGISLADLSRQLTPADLLDLQNEVNELQDEMMLKAVQDELANLENEVRSLERKLAEVRARGYAVERDLEADVTVLAAQWERVKTHAEGTMNHQTSLLSGQMGVIQGMLAQLMGSADNLNNVRPQYMQVKSAMASAEAQADAAEATVLTQYDEYADEVESLAAHLEWVGWMLEAQSTASFRLLATECGVAAVEASFTNGNSEPENGILFLTDQRLLWEDRVGDYELKVNVPLQQVERIEKVDPAEGEEEQLAFTFGAGAAMAEATFELSMPVSEAWLKMVGRARSGDYSQDRVSALDPAELERIKNAPQQCSNCGAVYTAPILRGQMEVTCEYCGLVTRL